jgi:hypothetical protein
MNVHAEESNMQAANLGFQALTSPIKAGQSAESSPFIKTQDSNATHEIG